jgi:hypothetical protein
MSASTVHHVLSDPKSGDVVQLPAGTHLQLTFRRRGLGSNEWRVAERPAHLMPLREVGADLQFLVFSSALCSAGGVERPLRLVRRRTDRPDTTEVRDVTVLVAT